LVELHAGQAMPLQETMARVKPSFADVYESWFNEVVRWIRAFGGPEADWHDLAQEVFLVVQRKLPTFRGESLPAWLYRITQRTVKDHRRRSWFRHLYLRPRNVILEDIQSAARNAEEQLLAKEDERLLFRLLERMSVKRRTAFILFEIEQYRCEEIAALEGVPIATIWTRLHHARKDYLAIVAAYQKKGSVP
jgi:RNA polymerase sigma-70 factor (ECF subfamily)